MTSDESVVASLLDSDMARETAAALINCGRAPTMVAIFMKKSLGLICLLDYKLIRCKLPY